MQDKSFKPKKMFDNLVTLSLLHINLTNVSNALDLFRVDFSLTSYSSFVSTVLSPTITVQTPGVETWCITSYNVYSWENKKTIINFFLSGNDYRINIGHLTGGSLASSYGGDISIGEVDGGSHARDFGYAPPPPPPCTSSPTASP